MLSLRSKATHTKGFVCISNSKSIGSIGNCGHESYQQIFVSISYQEARVNCLKKLQESEGYKFWTIANLRYISNDIAN